MAYRRVLPYSTDPVSAFLKNRYGMHRGFDVLNSTLPSLPLAAYHSRQETRLIRLTMLVGIKDGPWH